MTAKTTKAWYLGKDLNDICTNVYVDAEDLESADEETFQKLAGLGYEPDEDGGMWITKEDLPFDFIGKGDEEKEDYVFNDIMDDALKASANGYLVIAYGVRWNGANGYAIMDSRDRLFSRPYESTFSLTGLSPNRKVLEFTEYSHDVPMGSSGIIIALTKREREQAERWLFNENFKCLNAFADRFEEKYIAA